MYPIYLYTPFTISVSPTQNPKPYNRSIMIIIKAQLTMAVYSGFDLIFIILYRDVSLCFLVTNFNIYTYIYVDVDDIPIYRVLCDRVI